ncbi:MAG: hypothetical protein ACFNVQ_03560, partial [Campylobacter sp.]
NFKICRFQNLARRVRSGILKFQNSASHAASEILKSANFEILVSEKSHKILKFKIYLARLQNIYSIRNKIPRYDKILKFYARRNFRILPAPRILKSHAAT